MPSGTPTPHDGVVYRSRGMVLVVGDSSNIVQLALDLLARVPKFQIALFAPGVGSVADLPTNITAVGGRIVSLQGYLGQFSASVRVGDEKVEDAGIFSVNEDRRFDLVLDLCREPLLQQSVLPYGYYAPGDDPIALALALALDSLPQLLGDFHKQKYFDYRPQLCAHGAMGVVGCTRCLNVCPTKAIRSTGEKIEVDPFLCQGCASCTLACPTGALSFARSQALQDTLKRLLAEHAIDADANFLVVHDAATLHLLCAMETPGVLLFEVNPLPAFSESLCLSALIGGVSGVVLVMTTAAPLQSHTLIEQKVHELSAILASLGIEPTVLQIATPMNIGSAIKKLKSSPARPVQAAAVNSNLSAGKRERFLALVDALAENRHNGEQISEPLSLASGAAFGAVWVDTEKCTICHACTHLCPTCALGGQLDPVPTLNFKESLCVQCDLCRAGCPEKAISLQARFLPDAVAREAWRELANDQLASCTSCGIPFTGRRKLAVSLALMREHAQDMPGGIDSLRMCPSCRQRNTMMG